MFSRVLFLLVKILCLLHLHWSHCWPCLTTEVWRWNYPYPAVIRVILQELKCLCHVKEWLPCVRGGFRTLAKGTGGRVASSEWMKHREFPKSFRAKICEGGIHTDVLDIFPHTQTNPDGCRRIQSDQVMKYPYHYDKNIRIHCADKNLHPLFNACWTCTAILVSASSWSHLCISV